MGVYYDLVNYTRKEYISFHHIGGKKLSEIAGYPVTATLVTYYLLKYIGNQISFVADTDTQWPFPDGTYADLGSYRDVTDTMVEELVQYGYLADNGKEFLFKNDTESYVRRLRQTWNE